MSLRVAAKTRTKTTKLSFPLQPPVYRFDTKLTIDSFHIDTHNDEPHALSGII